MLNQIAIRCFLFLSLHSLPFIMQAQTIIPLYPEAVPNSKPSDIKEKISTEPDGILRLSNVVRPTLTMFLPSKAQATGDAVIICPGGGYSILAFDYEGTEEAQRFADAGIAAFVLKYRLPDDSIMREKEIGPLQDAEQAMIILRSRAAEWNINPHRIGIMGFSAGGHLASTLGTKFMKPFVPNPDKISMRPDFLLLIYPVISFDKRFGHMGSAHNLLGPNPPADKLIEFSNEKHVSTQTPPAFMVHAKDDEAVPVENTTAFADALKAHQVPVTVFLFEHGGHGFGMGNNEENKKWMDLCIQWIKKE